MSDYVSSKDRSEEDLNSEHSKSPMLKKTGKPKGWKPKQIKFMMPGESPIEAKRRLKNMYQENKQL